MDWKQYLKKAHRTTSHWQNGGLSAKLNFCTFLSAESVPHSLFFIKLAMWKHIGYVTAKLNFSSNLSATSPMRFPLAVIAKTNFTTLKFKLCHLQEQYIN